MPSEESQHILKIDDPRVPEAVKEHGRRFRNPARFVEQLGDGEYALFAGDGELLDLVCME